MSDQIYENWWMNLTEQDCGIYYRNQWYATESALNSDGYYIVYSRKLYLGENWATYKYHGDHYNINGEYYTYALAHALGYSTNRSWNYYYIDCNNLYYKLGYYNPTDGYYVDNTWYASLQDLNNAGYEVGTETTYIYKKHALKRYNAIVRIRNDVKYYYIADQTVNQWFTESEMDSLELSFLPSVEINWTVGEHWTTGVGHGGHNTYNSSYYNFARNSVIQNQSSMNALFGNTPNNTEYPCMGAWIGDSRSVVGDAVGVPLYFEYYYYSSSSYNLICSAYLSSQSGSYWGTGMNYQSIAVVYDRSAKLIKVYDNANFAYNAFKVTLNSTDYYYVLDYIHNDWITDVTSIGYSLDEYIGVRQINTYYGNNVKIPLGYDVQKVVGNNPNIFPSYVGTEPGTGYLVVAYEGKDRYLKNILPKHIRRSRSISGTPELPVVAFQQGTSLNENANPHLQCTQMTANRYNNDNGAINFIDVKVNGTDPTYGDYFILFKTDSTSYRSYFESGYPARFWYDVSPNGVHEYLFRESPNIWSFNKQTNTFSWLGDPTDPHDEAYYSYTDWKNAPSGQHVIKIFIYAENEADRIKNVAIYDIVDGSSKTIEYWPHDGYLYMSNYYTEQQLLKLGYSLTDTHENYNWEPASAIKLSTAQSLIIYYDSSVGYLVKDIGTYSTELDLNNAGYVISNVLFEVYYDNSTSTTYLQGGITKSSTSFNTSTSGKYARLLYLDSNFTQPWNYDGGIYVWDAAVLTPDINNSKYKVTSINQMPSSTTSTTTERTDAFFILTNSGTPLEPLKQSDSGLQMKMYSASNYTSDLHYSKYHRCIICGYSSFAGSETFYYSSTEYTLYYITVRGVRYYKLPSSGFFTESELLSKGYTRTASSIVMCSDTNVEFDIDYTYEIMYNSQHGYYANNRWCSTVSALNNEGYYLIEKVSKVIYLTNSIGYFAYNTRVIRTTTSFNTSYKKAYYLDENRTQPFLWDGHRWFCDTLTQYNDPNIWRNKLRDMPESTTGNYVRLLTMITASGNPITPYVQSELNTQMYLHLATSYSSDLSTDGNIVKTLIVAYWKLI